ncbi:Protein CBR-GST-3 [Caenorhabditis briggsae]|uniref:glutathione transferase n=2 Tax=Caenorhabditis briggsae TaxID=6238 RepID=A0AAE9AC63_CAEBR|nr:Protein CBR-GST-3 [Caenorhabditis briggsae]ULT95923.1 hypothetical protein L3Y34_004524 [Caenorhabditis briggsae]CAP24310.1 Protein CBR-GST-3 [Caenorhabditis briggsae]
MVQYKLTYFNARGLAEICRQLFYLAGVEFIDERLDEEGFAKLKSSLPTGQVPILYIDNVPFSQSTAIARYLARKFGFVGKTAEEELLADSIVDTFKDFIESFRKYVVAALTGKGEEKMKEIRENIMKPAVASYFQYLNKILEKSESGFLVGSQLTWADLVVADNLTTLINAEFMAVGKEKMLAEFREKIIETPKLKEWIDKRPVTRF